MQTNLSLRRQNSELQIAQRERMRGTDEENQNLISRGINFVYANVPVPSAFYDTRTLEPMRAEPILVRVSFILAIASALVFGMATNYYISYTTKSSTTITSPSQLEGYTCVALQKASVSFGMQSLPGTTGCIHNGNQRDSCLSVDSEEVTGVGNLFFEKLEDCDLTDMQKWNVSILTSTESQTFQNFRAPPQSLSTPRASTFGQTDIVGFGYGYGSCSVTSEIPTCPSVDIELNYIGSSAKTKFKLSSAVYHQISTASSSHGSCPWCQCSGKQPLSDSVFYQNTRQTSYFSASVLSAGHSRRAELQSDNGKHETKLNDPKYIQKQNEGYQQNIPLKTKKIEKYNSHPAFAPSQAQVSIPVTKQAPHAKADDGSQPQVQIPTSRPVQTPEILQKQQSRAVLQSVAGCSDIGDNLPGFSTSGSRHTLTCPTSCSSNFGNNYVWGCPANQGYVTSDSHICKAACAAGIPAGQQFELVGAPGITSYASVCGGSSCSTISYSYSWQSSFYISSSSPTVASSSPTSQNLGGILFSDSTYIDISDITNIGTALSAAPSPGIMYYLVNTKSTLFSKLSSGTPPPFVVIPRIVVSLALTTAERTTLRNYVSAGGRLVVLFANTHSINMMNGVFSYSMTAGSTYYTTTMTKSSSANELPLFATAPSSINSGNSYLYYQGIKLATLPSSAANVYSNTYGVSYVWESLYGSGRLVFLGFNWGTQYSSAQSQWDNLLHRSVEAVAQAPTPQPTKYPTTAVPSRSPVTSAPIEIFQTVAGKGLILSDPTYTNSAQETEVQTVINRNTTANASSSSTSADFWTTLDNNRLTSSSFVLIPELQANWTTTIGPSKKLLLQNFVQNGGVLIFLGCGSAHSVAAINHIFNKNHETTLRGISARKDTVAGTVYSMSEDALGYLPNIKPIKRQGLRHGTYSLYTDGLGASWAWYQARGNGKVIGLAYTWDSNTAALYADIKIGWDELLSITIEKLPYATNAPITSSPTTTTPTSAPSTAAPSRGQWDANVTTRVGRFCPPTHLNGLQVANSSASVLTYEVSDAIWGLCGNGTSHCSFECFCFPIGPESKAAIMQSIHSNLQVAWDGKKSSNLCEPWVDIPPYTCTKSETNRVNSVFASLSLALGSLTFFYYAFLGVCIVFWHIFPSCCKDEDEEAANNDSNKEPEAVAMSPVGVVQQASGDTKMVGSGVHHHRRPSNRRQSFAAARHSRASSHAAGGLESPSRI